MGVTGQRNAATYRTGRLGLVLYLSVWACAHAGPVGVYYPEIDGPYGSVFAQILQGIREVLGADAVVSPRPSTAETPAGTFCNACKTSIALGQRGLEEALRRHPPQRIVAGAIRSLPASAQREITGVSLMPDPGAMFARLKALYPKVRRVSLVYQPTQSGWWVALARAAGEQQQLVLRALAADTLRDAAQHYETLYRSRQPGDVIWLLPDHLASHEQTMLPHLLERAWDLNLPIVSTNPAHVRSGALLALYPDNRALGAHLARLALDLEQGTVPHIGLTPLADVRVAYNVRTANHLDLRAPSTFGVDLVFPTR